MSADAASLPSTTIVLTAAQLAQIAAGKPVTIIAGALVIVFELTPPNQYWFP